MLLHRSHLRRLALLCLLCATHYSFAVKPPPHPARPPISPDAASVTCRYRLEGLQTEFTKANLPEAHYSSLPPGNYTFQVTCDSPQLRQSISGADSFTVAGPWWQSLWWQRWLTEIAGSGGVVLLLVGIVWKRYSDRRENVRLEIAVAERSAALALANHELQEASISDPLTGVRNRRFFQSMIAADASQAIRAYRGSEVYSRDHRDLIFFLIDIDHFKAVNDEYGHDAGDRVLVQIAQRLNSVVRESDFLIRWGGEEFLVVCRSAERSEGELLASRMLKAINGAEFDLGSGRRLTKSCSLGWAAFPWLPPAFSNLSVDEVLRLADRGLYLAKQQGRNQSVGMVPTTNSPAISTATVDSSSATVLTRPDKYSCLEQLLEAKLIREVRTQGGMATAVAG
jgi:diguanylate cyclase (GGDEF)-like protein